MKNLFVPYEIALKLKEKGFDELCFGWFQPEVGYTNVQINWNAENPHRNSNFKEHENSIGEVIAAPLYQQVVDFFREKHNIEIHNPLKQIEEDEFRAVVGWCGVEDWVAESSGKGYYISFQKAIEEALKLIP